MSLAEDYVNTLYCGHPCKRWWAGPRLLVGGSIVSFADAIHLGSFGVKAVISVESERDDEGRNPYPHIYKPTPDDGTPPPVEWWREILAFARLYAGGVIYVHCQMGGSRSPAVAYAILRDRGASPDEALGVLREFKPTYGEHHYHKSYLAAAEAALTR